MPSASAAPGTGTAPAYSLMTRHAVQKFPVRGRSRDRPGRHVCELPEDRRVARAAAAALAGPGHDELLFIVIHQVYELWFKELLHELDRVRQWLEDDEPHRAQHTLKRILFDLESHGRAAGYPRDHDAARIPHVPGAARGRERFSVRPVPPDRVRARRQVAGRDSPLRREAARGSRWSGAIEPTVWDAFLHPVARRLRWCRHRISNATWSRRSNHRRTCSGFFSRYTGRTRRTRSCASGWSTSTKGPGVALPAREDGGADDRREAWDAVPPVRLTCWKPSGGRSSRTSGKSGRSCRSRIKRRQVSADRPVRMTSRTVARWRLRDGIRAKGHWTRKIARVVVSNGRAQGRNVVAVAPTYGCFAMLPFLLPWTRRANRRALTCLAKRRPEGGDRDRPCVPGRRWRLESL